MLVFAILGFANAAIAQTYLLTVKHVSHTNNTATWDAYLLRTGATDLKMASIQFGFGFDISIINGGTLTASLDGPSSELPEAFRNTSITVGATQFVGNGTPIPVGQTHRYVNVAAGAAPANQAAAPSISNVNDAPACSHPGTRIARITLTNTVNWAAGKRMNIIFSTALGSQRTNTTVFAFTATTTQTGITNTANHLNYNTTNVAGTCDANPILVCPTITLTPPAGALAGGTIGSPYSGATVSASGGTAPYGYAVTAGTLPAGLSISSSTGAISGTPTGPGGTSNFTVTATDAGGCTGASAYSINVVSGCDVSGTAIVTQPSCVGGTGSAVVTLSGTGSTGAGTYSVDGNAPINFASSPFTVNGLTVGNHTIVATMTTGGCVSSNISANVTAAAAFTGSAEVTQPTCFGGTGSATITLSAGGGGTYTIDGGSPISYSGNTFTIASMADGSYSVVATSAAGCISNTMSVTITAPAQITGSGTPTATSCATLNDGSASILLSTSTSGTYTLDGGSPVNYTSNPFTINGLAAGPHTVVATTGGCSSSLIGFTVGSAPAFTGSATTTPTTCGAGSTGTATVTLSTSTSGTYSLDGNPSVAYNSNPFTITGLSAGAHSVVATNGGCSSSSIEFTVGGSSNLTASYVKTNISACNAGNDGTITVTPAGGTAPYHYAWSGGYPGFAPGDVSSVTNLPIGYYNVTVSDAGGCGTVVFTNIHIGFAFTVVVTNSGSNTNSCGGSTGSIILYGNAGISPYTYALSAVGGGPAGTYQASNTFLNLAAGNYTAYVKDAGGCVGTKSVTVAASAPIVVTPFTRASSSCNADGSIEIYRSGGIPPYSYSIDGTNYFTSPVFTGLAANTYTAYVKDSKGCVGQASATVAQGAALFVSTSKTNTSSCVNDGSIQITASGGVAPYTYSINGGSTYGSSSSFTGLGAANYSISVKDSKGCLGSASVSITINTITVTATPTASSTCTSNNGKIQLFRTGGVGPYTYSIDGNNYFTSPVFSNLPPATYTGYVKDSKACIGFVENIVVGPSGCTPRIATNSTNVKVRTVATATKVAAYPNPSSSSFTLQLTGYNSKEKVSIVVTDFLGRAVYQTEGMGKLQYNFGANFITGMYNVQVLQGTDKKSLKLVKE